MGEMNKQVCEVKVDQGMAIAVLLMGILLGGLGTIIVAFLQKDEGAKKNIIIVGVLQWFLSFLLVGWLWAIWTSWKIYNNSK